MSAEYIVLLQGYQTVRCSCHVNVATWSETEI
jgi:hypothetical protein